jgi:hypothetical protein
MNYDHTPDRRLLTGTGGSGKSTEFIRLLKAHRAVWKFVFDPEREVSRKVGWRICRDVPSMAVQAAARQPVCFDPSDICDTLEEGFDLFCRFVWNFSCGENGVKLIACDEVQDFTLPGNGGIPATLKRLLQKGRRQEIDVLIIAQSLGELHDRVRGQLSHIVTFRHEDALPLDWLKRNGFDPEAVKALRYPGGWICRNRYTGELTINGRTRKTPQPARA